jgi:nucleoid-associated protein YgaU
MFTAMISRYNLLIALGGLALALGVGWAGFELGRRDFADTPPTVTSAPPAEQATGDAAKLETQAPPSSALDTGPASGSDPGADAPAASSAAPEAEPGITSDVAEPPSSEAQARATAPRVGGGGAEAGAARDQPAASEAPADSDPALEAPPKPSVAAPAETMAEQSEPNEPAAQPDADESVALAVPAPADRQPGPAPDPSPAPPSADTQAPVANETTRSPEPARPADEPRSAPARAAERMKRALATLFGGATDEPAPPRTERAEVAAVPDSAPAAAAPGQQSGPGDLEPGAAPSFDIVRIEPGGRAVMAGRAAPGAEVEIRSGDRTVDRVRADRRGEWVALPPEPLAAGVQELSLAARVENQPAMDSEEVVVVAVPDPPPPEIALGPLDQPSQPQPVRVTAAQPSDAAFAVALPREGAGAGRILQAPGRISSDGALALVMLDYDDAGRIRLSGEASAGASLRIYVDNQPAGATVVGPGGKWDAVLEHTLTPGDYMLRLDQLGASGKPDARLETPFTRVSQPPVAGDVQVDYVIVQPGNSLWRIARRVLGEGMQYVHIYEANQAQIRDPDLIYPGQVFELPRGVGAAG